MLITMQCMHMLYHSSQPHSHPPISSTHVPRTQLQQQKAILMELLAKQELLVPNIFSCVPLVYLHHSYPHIQLRQQKAILMERLAKQELLIPMRTESSSS